MGNWIDSCTDIFKYHKEKLFGYLVEKFYIFRIMNGDAKAEDSRRQMDMALTQAAESLIQRPVWSDRELSLKTIAEDMMYLFKECVAELIGILTLEIPMDEYLHALVNSVQEQGGGENRIDTINLVRSVLVYIRLGTEGDFGESGLWITMDNLRTIRKLMEMAGEGQGLLVMRKEKAYAIEGLVSHNRKGLDSYISFNGF